MSSPDAVVAAETATELSRAGTFRSLRHRSARLFFFGLFVSMVGTWLQFTATSFLLYDLTGRATDMGLNAMFQFLPMLFLGAWAGGFADRRDRRVVTLCTQASLAVLGATGPHWPRHLAGGLCNVVSPGHYERDR